MPTWAAVPRVPDLVRDSPRYAALVLGLRFVNDLSLQHHGLPGSYFLSQQIAHSGGELWLGLYDLRGLLLHYKRAKWEQEWGNIVPPVSWITSRFLPLNQNLQKVPKSFLEFWDWFPDQHQLLPQLPVHPEQLLTPEWDKQHWCLQTRDKRSPILMITTDAPSATVVAKLQHSSQFTWPDESTSWYLIKHECSEVMHHAQQLLHH